VLFDVDVEPPPTDDEPKKRPRRKTKVADEDRADVVEICEYLANAVAAGGSKRPPIGKKWFTEARLLLDEKRDPQATTEKVKALIDWIQSNDWWKPRVLAMPKLRAKYDEIRLDAVRDFKRKQAVQNEQPRSGSRGQPWQPPSDQADYDKPFSGATQ
jgi:hypothetical protein